MVEPEDAMRWWVIRRNPDGFDFREADEVVAFARARKMKVRGLCLVWDHIHPDWLAHPRGRALVRQNPPVQASLRRVLQELAAGRRAN
jgi:GH35 family endo-1,4-beta-xylanase